MHEKYVELLIFEEVMNIPEIKAYELTDEEKVPVIRNWFGQKGLQVIKMFTNEETEKTIKDSSQSSVTNLLHHNRPALSLQCRKLQRKTKE